MVSDVTRAGCPALDYLRFLKRPLLSRAGPRFFRRFMASLLMVAHPCRLPARQSLYPHFEDQFQRIDSFFQPDDIDQTRNDQQI